MSNQDRIDRLSRRFQSHGAVKPKKERRRERHSLYLDGDLIERLDQEYRDTEHELYPKALSKSEFLEAVLEKGLEHLDCIKSELSQGTE